MRGSFLHSLAKQVFPFNTKLRSWETQAIRSVGHRSGPETSNLKGDGDDRESKNLLGQIRARILATGPITVADYMREVLANPMSGYYMSKDVFGAQGDFITSPEISQVFGELIGIWMINEWRRVGSPRPLQLVELGPGRGTLMADVLRVFAKLETSLHDISVHLVEISPFLSNIQEAKLCGSSTNPSQPLSASSSTSSDSPFYKVNNTLQGMPVYWHHHLPDLPAKYSSFVAHEFFDALPVHQLVKTPAGWREILVDLDPTDQLRFVLSRHRTPACFFVPIDTIGEKVEVSPESLNIIQQICQRLESEGGSALIVDYGHLGEKGHTFRAFKKHALHDPLVDPGIADLTADVDFRQFQSTCRRSSAPCSTYGPVTQRDFLLSMGLRERVQTLMSNLATDRETKESLKSAATMLTDQEEMGERFKFFAMFPEVLKLYLKKRPPAGFFLPQPQRISELTPKQFHSRIRDVCRKENNNTGTIDV